MPERNSQYQFIQTSASELESSLVAEYERLAEITARPGSPERQVLKWATYAQILLKVWANYIGNQNIPSRAEGENLDALAELFYIQERPAAQPATVTQQFKISAEQDTPILIPSGTRVTDASQALVWETDQDWYIQPGATEIEVPMYCQTPGIIGNGYAEGQLSNLVDVFDYYLECSNVTVSDGGSDVPSDDEFYELMRASMDAYSTAGPIGSYLYHAKKVSTEIADVVANSPNPGEVRIYVLTNDGKIAEEELKKAVLAACNADEVRPLTDKVLVEDPQTIEYNIDFTYYLQSDSSSSSNAIQAAVNQAVDAFVAWQSGKLGRDINPSRLIADLMATGIKRVDLKEPAFKVLQDGVLEFDKSYELTQTIPQLAKLGTRNVVNGGFEDE